MPVAGPEDSAAAKLAGAITGPELHALTAPKSARRNLVLMVALLVPGVIVLYSVPPTEGSFYPKCVFYWATGLHCPGCGTARSLHALLNGHVLQAIAYNPILLLLIPFLVYNGLSYGFFAWNGRRVTSRRLPAWSIHALFVIIVAFWILRNLPYLPFALLAPHELVDPPF